MTKAINEMYYVKRINNVQSELTQEEMLFFKKGLKEEEKKIKKNLNISSNEMDNVINYNPKDEADHASISLEQTLSSKISEIQAKKLVFIKKSLKKIETNCYGICDLCSEPINIERLKIKMFAEYCICCREIVEQGRH